MCTSMEKGWFASKHDSGKADRELEACIIGVIVKFGLWKNFTVAFIGDLGSL